MQDWKEKIQAIIDEHAKKRAEVTTTLNTLLSELKVFAGGIKAQVIEVTDYPLTWKIEINGKVFLVTENDVDMAQTIMDQWEKPTGEKRDLNEVIQELLVEKFGE
ncbi:hypothetical protein ABE237_00755 [Brevibacillus formosus]|uniref:hypothetical protein n=1 Tax=Brevibacillus formosus TaxID=54913 RepID=UPI0018CC99C7|nr:hypothetical protein [Brevibacillus formosus]MBG9944678.1 hypothetical protein [Brevibacillus formosus]